MTANLRSKLHVYGFGHLTETVTYLGDGVAGFDYDVNDADTGTVYTDNNNSFIGYIGTGTTNTDLAA